MSVRSFASASHPIDWSLESFARPRAAVLRQLVDSVRIRRRVRVIEAELMTYTPAELAELGISEADICRVAADGARTA
jgi:hypothetical protein